MPNRRHNKQVPGFKIGGRVAKMKGGSMNGKPISKSKNVGLAKMIESPKGKEAAKQAKGSRMMAKKGSIPPQLKKFVMAKKKKAKMKKNKKKVIG